MMKKYNKIKLFKFLNNNENRFLVVGLGTLLSYLATLVLFDNMIVRLLSYFIYFFIYSKIYTLLLIKLSNSLKTDTNKDLL